METASTNVPKLIVMLTHHDKTVSNAYEVFDQCKDAQAEWFGFKEEPLDTEEMKRIFNYMKRCGKRTFLEVVAYTEAECLKGAEKAATCGVDTLMGTVYFESVHAFCKKYKMKYMPFVGDIRERPSVLDGTVDSMISQAKTLIEKGVDGFDLLAYRYTGDPEVLIRRFISEVNAPICIAGSIDRYERLDLLRETRPDSFTIGSAFFEHCFGGSFEEQINRVYEYMKRGER